MSQAGEFQFAARAWWFANLPGHRTHPDPYLTYYRFALDEQPSIGHHLNGDLAWLEARPSFEEWAITQDENGAHTRVQALPALEKLLAHRPVDPVFKMFIGRADLQRKVRSFTGCYLDLGDIVVPIDNTGDALVHFLSDQQWSRHWLVCCGEGPRMGTVYSADLPYGFDTSGWGEEDPMPTSTPAAFAGLEVCADSFEEFLYRFWVENEVAFAVTENREITDPYLQEYAQLLTRRV